jgi:small subunit ribosomal protein S5
MAHRDEAADKFDERVVNIARVDKVHKGGRTLSWRALVVVGDNEGRVGAAIGKAKEMPDAIRKGSERARRGMIAVPLIGSTIPHEVEQKVQTAKVLLRPASEGTGVIAGSAVRAVMEAAGIRDVLSKSFGSDNVVNIVWATMACLRDLKSVDQVAQLRGKRAEDIPFRPRGRSQQNGH